MKLFLASLDHQVLDHVLPLLPKAPSSLKLAFIPTAADTYTDKPWIVESKKKIHAMKFDVTEYDFKNKTSEQIKQDLLPFDVIHIPGGNTFYLLHQMRITGFDSALRDMLDKSKVYIGSSAGSCVMGADIDAVKTVDHPELVPDLASTQALGIIPDRIVPHWGKEKYIARQELIAKEWGDKILKLRDDQALIIDGNVRKIISSEE